MFMNFDPEKPFDARDFYKPQARNPFSLDDLLANTILNTDTYKATHYTFEEEGTTGDYAYIEARKGGQFNEVTFFGLQYFVLYYLTKPITMETIDDAEEQLVAHGVPFNREGWEYIVKKHNGFMPVRIKALPEGITAKHGVVQITIEATDPKCAWAARYVETAILRAAWFGSSIAARIKRWEETILPYLERTGTPETLEFKIVDFGARGSETTESAGVAGAAVLIGTQVTDNQMGIRLARKAYPSANENTGVIFMPGNSIPATEHSVTTAWLEERETEFFRNILKVHGYKPMGPLGRNLVSVVIDTYDQDRAIGIWGTTLKAELIASTMCVVFRPDSGDPLTNVVHVLNELEKYFGSTINAKGFKMLPDYARVIQGDGIDETSLPLICAAIEAAGWSLDNVNFGSGGGLLQKDITRDTHRYAQKASQVIVNGEVRDINKNPKTDPTKASKKGRFTVVFRDGELVTIPEGTQRIGEHDFLELVYENGVVHRIQSFRNVREIARAYA